MLEELKNAIGSVETSKWTVGAAALLVPILQKADRLGVTVEQRAVLEHWYVDILFMFTLAFASTRDLLVSLLLTVTAYVMLNHVFSTDGAFPALKKKTGKSGRTTNKQVGDALDLLERAYKERQTPVKPPWV